MSWALNWDTAGLRLPKSRQNRGSSELVIFREVDLYARHVGDVDELQWMLLGHASKRRLKVDIPLPLDLELLKAHRKSCDRCSKARNTDELDAQR